MVMSFDSIGTLQIVPFNLGNWPLGIIATF